MWAPSTSASVISTTLWYRASERLNSSWTPVPIAVINAWISLLARTLSIRLFSTLMILPRSGKHRLGVAVAALLRRAARRVALDDEQLRLMRILDRAVRELAGESRVLERRLPPGQIARLARGIPGPGGVDRLDQDPAGVGGVLLEEVAERAVDDLLDETLDRGVAELGLRLALELRIGELHRDHRGEALPDVLPAQVLVLLLDQTAVSSDGIEGAGERRAEAGEMRPALVGVDVVG